MLHHLHIKAVHIGLHKNELFRAPQHQTRPTNKLTCTAPIISQYLMLHEIKSLSYIENSIITCVVDVQGNPI